MSARSDSDYDPTFVHARREAIVILATWLCALLWTVPYCYLHGYLPKDPSDHAMVWGIPSWVFWGVVLPWLVADVITAWFCFRYMAEDDLGAECEERVEQDAGQRRRDEGRREQ